jgi:hypothetical protein
MINGVIPPYWSETKVDIAGTILQQSCWTFALTVIAWLRLLGLASTSALISCPQASTTINVWGMPKPGLGRSFRLMVVLAEVVVAVVSPFESMT